MESNKKGINLLKEDGFTLTEMLIVISLIAIIGTFSINKIMDSFTKAKVDSTKIIMKNIGTVLDDFKRECNFYPLEAQGLEALITKPISGRDCKNYDPNGYLKGKKVPTDAWNFDFIYKSDGSTYEIISLGADSKEGGDGVNKDISSKDLE